ncbi:hypothetical protein HDZ31DRAFT_69698, partial [Schizophyllum fasciatum]
MALPASRDDFFHDGSTFYVEIDGKHRHPRCDASSLHGLLTYTPGPVLTKKGQVAKRQPPPHKDPPAHFYTAQMLHYGLKPLKTRDPAKRKLLAAFEGRDTLAVPAHILQLEQELATEFAVSGENTVSEPTKAKTKSDKRTGRAVAFAGQEPKQRSEAVDEADGQPTVVDVQALRSSLGRLVHRDLVNILVHVGKDAAVYRAIGEQIQRLQDPVTMPAAEPNIKQKTRKTSTTTKPKPTAPPPVDPVLVVENEDVSFPPRTKNATKKSGVPPKPAAPPPKAQANGPFQPIGVYKISAPYMEEQWPEYTQYGATYRLTVRPSSTGAHLWGTFDFGAMTGIIRSIAAAPTAVGLTSKFLWRGAEGGEGEMQLGDDQKGYIKFLAGGRIQGRIEGSFIDKAEFTGELEEVE